MIKSRSSFPHAVRIYQPRGSICRVHPQSNNQSNNQQSNNRDIIGELDALHQRAVLMVTSLNDKRQKIEDIRSSTLASLKTSVKELVSQEIESIKEMTCEFIVEGSDAVVDQKINVTLSVDALLGEEENPGGVVFVDKDINR